MRIVQYLITMVIVLSLNFFLPRMMPGDPLAVLEGDPSADMPMLLTEEARAKLLAYYDLDKPLLVQYRDYLLNLARGDLGWSIYYNVPVTSLLWGRLKWTLLLMGIATTIYTALGILLGTISAWYRGSKTDLGLLGGVFALGSWPSFFLAMLLIIVFSVKLDFFPIGGVGNATGEYSSALGRTLDVAYHLFLPCVALVLSHLPSVYLVMRNSLLSVLGRDYIRTARAKGLRERFILSRHAFPNGLLPVITMIAMRFGFLITGTISVEVVFSYPGMGTLLYEAFRARDYPVLQGAFLLIMVTVLFFNLLAEFLYARLDPRTRRRWTNA